MSSRLMEEILHHFYNIEIIESPAPRAPQLNIGRRADGQNVTGAGFWSFGLGAYEPQVFNIK